MTLRDRLFATEDRTSDALVVVLNGASRTTLLVGPLACKFPSLRYGWRSFLRGLLSNSNERDWWHSDLREGLCPLIWSLPGGFLNVMPRCEPVVDVAKVYDSFIARGRCCAHARDEHDDTAPACAGCPPDTYEHEYGPAWLIPAECKDDSFGWLGGDGAHGGRLVVIDYGG